MKLRNVRGLSALLGLASVFNPRRRHKIELAPEPERPTRHLRPKKRAVGAKTKTRRLRKAARLARRKNRS